MIFFFLHPPPFSGEHQRFSFCSRDDDDDDYQLQAAAFEVG